MEPRYAPTAGLPYDVLEHHKRYFISHDGVFDFHGDIGYVRSIAQVFGLSWTALPERALSGFDFTSFSLHCMDQFSRPRHIHRGVLILQGGAYNQASGHSGH